MERTSRRDARARVVGVLAEAGAVSRADLARRAALAPSTVSAVVSDLHAAGLVVEPAEPVHPAERGTVGRPPVLIALHRRAGVVAGIDFGKRHLRLAISDLSHSLLAERHRALDADLPAKEAIALAQKVFADALEEAEVARDEVVRVGLGLPGPVHRPSGELGNSTILPGWAGTRAAEAVAEALELPVEVENDANLGALGEWMWGAGTARAHGLRQGLDRYRSRVHRRQRAVRRRGRDGGRARPHGRRSRRADLPLRQPRLPGDLRRRARDPQLAARRPRRRLHAAGGRRARRPRRRWAASARSPTPAPPSAPRWPRSATCSTRTGSSSAATWAWRARYCSDRCANRWSAARYGPRRKTSRLFRANWAIVLKCWELLRWC